jgi:hypothetical protein
VVGLPPLDAIDNEDWGRDYLLSRFLDIPAPLLAEAGLSGVDLNLPVSAITPNPE